MTKSTADLALSHAYLNTLYSGLQGSFVSANCLAQLGHQGVKLPGAESVKPVLDWLVPRIQALWKGEPTEPACMAQALAILKQELVFVAQLVTKSLNRIQTEASPDDAKFIVACSARFAYGREHFIKGLLSYCECFELGEQADLWRQRLLGARRDVLDFSLLFNAMKAGPELTEAYRLNLWNDSAGLSGAFRTQFTDIAAIEGRTKGGFTIEMLGLAPEAAAAWKASGTPPEACAHWLSWQFNSGEARAWRAAGFTDPAYAGNWKLRGFDIAAAVECHNAGLTPRQAYLELLSGQGGK